MNKTACLAIVCTALCFCTALAVVYSKHLSRQRYAELSEYQQVLDDLDIRWSQLQIEESTFSEHGLVERTARDRLRMSFPGLEGSMMIVRQAQGSGS